MQEMLYGFLDDCYLEKVKREMNIFNLLLNDIDICYDQYGLPHSEFCSMIYRVSKVRNLKQRINVDYWDDLFDVCGNLIFDIKQLFIRRNKYNENIIDWYITNILLYIKDINFFNDIDDEIKDYICDLINEYYKKTIKLIEQIKTLSSYLSKDIINDIIIMKTKNLQNLDTFVEKMDIIGRIPRILVLR